MELSAAELAAVAAGPFSDPIIQEYTIDRPLAAAFDWLIEVGLRRVSPITWGERHWKHWR